MNRSRKIVLTYVAKPLQPRDERIEMFLSNLEKASGTDINSFIAHSNYFPKEIETDRVEFVSQWLCEPNEFGVPATLTNGLREASMLLVTVKNMRPIDNSRTSGPHSLGSRVSLFEVQVDEESGCLPIFRSHFEKLAVGLLAYWGVLRSPALMAQLRRSKSMYRELFRLATHVQQRKLLESAKDEYVYEIEPRTIKGIGPDRVEFDAYLDWTNFWGNAMAASLKFPDETLDKPLEGLYDRVDDIGWVVRLTKEPTDLDQSEHLAQFRWAYKRFGM